MIRLHVRSSCTNAIARTISESYRSCECTISLISEGLNSYLKSRTCNDMGWPDLLVSDAMMMMAADDCQG
jgi:hypothetical protein